MIRFLTSEGLVGLAVAQRPLLKWHLDNPSKKRVLLTIPANHVNGNIEFNVMLKEDVIENLAHLHPLPTKPAV